MFIFIQLFGKNSCCLRLHYWCNNKFETCIKVPIFNMRLGTVGGFEKIAKVEQKSSEKEHRKEGCC